MAFAGICTIFGMMCCTPMFWQECSTGRSKHSRMEINSCSIAGMLCEGRFALYLAGEPYKSGLKAQGCGKLKKAVFRIALDEDPDDENDTDE